MSTILIIDDNDSDFDLARQGLEEAGVRQRIHRARDSAETETFLRDHRPHLILLDPSLRGGQGLELLRWLKRGRQGLATPVLVLTTSDDPGDIQVCLRAGANAYIRKPLHLEAFLGSMRCIAEFWLQIALTGDLARAPRPVRVQTEAAAVDSRYSEAQNEAVQPRNGSLQ